MLSQKKTWGGQFIKVLVILQVQINGWFIQPCLQVFSQGGFANLPWTDNIGRRKNA